MADAKARYDSALDELEKLVARRRQLDDKRVLDAYHAGGKAADEIIGFIRSDSPKTAGKQAPGDFSVQTARSKGGREEDDTDAV